MMLSNKKLVSRKRVQRFVALMFAVGMVFGFSANTIYAITEKESKAIYGDHALYEDNPCSDGSTTPTNSNTSYLIGDSVSEGVKTSLEGTITGITVNAKASRTLTSGSSELDGLSVLEKDVSSYKDVGSVVIALGTNSSGLNDQNIKQAVVTIKQNNSQAKIYWVNVGVDNSKRNSNLNGDALNQTIQNNASEGYTVIDWATQVKQHPEFVNDLGVHLTETGKPAFAGVISSSLGGTSAPSASSGASNANSVDSEVCCAASATSSLVGADNPEKAWNFFIGKGLTPPQTAGILGNMKRESGINPLRVQSTKTPDEDSPDPNAAGGKGWGLIQWTPGSKAINAAAQAGISTPIHELATQLELVWGHMNGKPPITTGKFDINQFKAINDVTQAVIYFETHIEGAGVKAIDVRSQFAQEFLTSYGSGTSATGPSGGNCGNGVTIDGYAFPVSPQKKSANANPPGLSRLPCTSSTSCHHDNSPAFDLGNLPGSDAAAGSPVYAISDGTIDRLGIFANIDGCFKLSLSSTKDGFWYWYGHIQNPTVKNGDSVKAGQQIAEVGIRKCTKNYSNPHLHIDRGCVIDGIKKPGGNVDCRDVGMIELMNKLFEALPD